LSFDRCRFLSWATEPQQPIIGLSHIP
jgi:hypothetical protein